MTSATKKTAQDGQMDNLISNPGHYLAELERWTPKPIPTDHLVAKPKRHTNEDGTILIRWKPKPIPTDHLVAKPKRHTNEDGTILIKLYSEPWLGAMA